VELLHQRSVRSLSGVGPQLEKKLAQLGIFTVQDVIFHLPARYEDRTKITPIRQLRSGDWAVVTGVLEGGVFERPGRRRQWVSILKDATGTLELRYFHFPPMLGKLEPGTIITCYGEVRGFGGVFLFVHPEMHVGPPVLENLALTPIYPSTTGLSQLMLRRLTTTALAQLNHPKAMPEYLPSHICEEFAGCSLVDALKWVHQPPPETSVAVLLSGTHPFQRRLAFEELLAQRLSVRRMRDRFVETSAPVFTPKDDLYAAFIKQLPFQLTEAQVRVLGEITSDLQKPQPMLRLVQGDVGSGKTVVGACAALPVIASGYQVALMAPTELLAKQHDVQFKKWFESLGKKVVLLHGSLSGKARSSALADIASGEAHIVIGTHALFQKDVIFDRLGLVMIDEQHRFGVAQRLALREKSREHETPHQLVLTATPIPRTLAMVAYADLQQSIIDALPPMRQPIQTVVMSNTRRADVVARVRGVCDQGQQVYWVCPLIEASEQLTCENVIASAEQLALALPGITIGYVHGRMSESEKSERMTAFRSGEIQILAATTVIEVGVDVPNATLMVIENAERLGLSQLHQLRGRVGRGAKQSYCVLLYQIPLSALAQQRLQVMRESNDGFWIAERDLALRGPGELLGTKQTGLPELKVADFVRDASLLDTIQSVSDQLMQEYPQVVDPLIRRWLGIAERYGEV